MLIKGQEVKLGDQLRALVITGEVIGTVVTIVSPEHAIIEHANGWTPQSDDLSKYGLDSRKKYWHVFSHYVTEHIPAGKMAIEKPIPINLRCLQCGTPSPYGTANRPDGAFLCWSCTSTYGWKYA